MKITIELQHRLLPTVVLPYLSDRFFHFLRSREGGETESGRDSLLCRNLSTPCCSRRRGTR